MPQMGPLPWVFLMSCVLSLILMLLNMVYFLKISKLDSSMTSGEYSLYSWLW